MFGGILTFTLALATSFSLTVPIRQIALRLGMVDHPGPRKVHRTPMPLLGGIAIYCGAGLSIVLSVDARTREQIFSILAASALLLVVGILDDRGLLHHQIKLFVAMPLAALTLIASGIQTHLASALAPGSVGRALDIGLTLFWVVGITAAFSILDHMDGLVSGVAAIASFFFTWLAFRDGQVMVGTLGAAVLGASLGFLRWNFNPAKIFMGDGGAMFLGFMMATLGLKLRLSGVPEATTWMIPVLLLIVPILDTTLVSISRTRRGLIPFTSPGKDHVARRLAKAGLNQRGAVLTLYAVGTVSGFVGLLVSGLPMESAYVLVVIVALAVLAALIALERLPYEPQEMPGDAP
jgi:UDP-GlcNAc:undecaprenyl-phosphate/decaprenyl-phosphate GlcNAc-1-phosphate transferase